MQCLQKDLTSAGLSSLRSQSTAICLRGCSSCLSRVPSVIKNVPSLAAMCRIRWEECVVNSPTAVFLKGDKKRDWLVEPHRFTFGFTFMIAPMRNAALILQPHLSGESLPALLIVKALSPRLMASTPPGPMKDRLSRSERAPHETIH